MVKEDISLAEAGAFIDELMEKFYFNRETELIDVFDQFGRKPAEEYNKFIELPGESIK